MTRCRHKHNQATSCRRHQCPNAISTRNEIEMVQIIVHCDQLAEWCLIELQGRLEQSDGCSESTDPAKVGNIYFDDKNTPYIIIGSHILDGKVVQIDKPLVVLEKGTLNDQSSESDMNHENKNKSVEYSIKGIIKTKLIFKSRPKPIVLQQYVKKRPRVK
ncbi:uncharacterized protein TRIADDRAFT_55593 [Trichoplax adhaerens]|uniref:Chromosome transmission fidelity protein 8 n=1 Tax=Trichoplax adhaerens TaxID=10228 RepID=B3RVB3_TRIAD|nr:hypothetical protein TRIADDRAFT_55593 [Trichoplax adhaerens]EDV25472.1 hypothetical protein TRIADDRAFT_55593 [Trichoplax adhaerens]|eukprot:XP_002111505.1 hypothetical protein TRIADDRAFT_55593 [Trichoplax adhaerens]